MKFKHLSPSSSSSSSLSTISFKQLRSPSKTVISLDLKTLTSPTSKCSQLQNSTRDLSPSGGTRWNPTQEQIRKLEALYLGGMRTPNAEQIDLIKAELRRDGRIEGKNVFYWFQNHKARERQRQKRSAALLALYDNAPHDPIMSLFSAYKEEKEAEEYSDGSCKRKCRSWNFGEMGLELEDRSDGTLQLFPLHPERGR